MISEVCLELIPVTRSIILAQKKASENRVLGPKSLEIEGKGTMIALQKLL